MTYNPILLALVPGGPYFAQPFANPQPFPLHADTADFTDYGDRGKLATLGIFSTDSARFREKRAGQAATERMYDDAYAAFNLDRKREHARIAAEIEATLTNGVWARSTGEYARRCHALDRAIAERIYERIV